MEIQRQQLPNSKLILIFGILSILGCLCYGIVGAIFGIIALVMAKKATDIYSADPSIYSGFQNVKIGRILAIIGLVLSFIFLISLGVAIFSYGGLEGFELHLRELQEELEKNK
jgi:F0F1-type ATP synthase membrane subunit c/vacuolar-type H+-ATPase subunit K